MKVKESVGMRRVRPLRLMTGKRALAALLVSLLALTGCGRLGYGHAASAASAHATAGRLSCTQARALVRRARAPRERPPGSDGH